MISDMWTPKGQRLTRWEPLPYEGSEPHLGKALSLSWCESIWVLDVAEAIPNNTHSLESLLSPYTQEHKSSAEVEIGD